MAKVNYTYATGRRKTSSARVFLKPADEKDSGVITVNKRNLTDYFPLLTTQQKVLQPIEEAERKGVYDLKVTVAGGGISSQAGAVRHGIARALIEIEPELRGSLKKAGFLTRDAREVERKKPGRHKARKKPQFSKR